MVTLIIPSWDRIKNLKQILTKYRGSRIVNEVIVFNNNPRHDLQRRIRRIDPKIILIQSNIDLGMYVRFLAAGLASNNCILHTDDDLFVPDPTIEALYSNWLEKPSSCHGTQGRNIVNGYNTFDAFGLVKVLLTRCMMTSTDVCRKAFELSRNFVHLESIPKGNGEDIILSYAGILVSGELNNSYKLPFYDLPGYRSATKSIHLRWPDHYKHRQKVVDICEKILSEQNVGTLVK